MIIQGGTVATPWSPTAEDVGAAPAIADSTYKSCYYRMVDGEKAWINPPMKADQEYLTTEMWHGKKVYTQLVYCGDVPTMGRTIVPHILNCRIIDYHGSVSSKDSLPFRDPYDATTQNGDGTIDIAVTGDNIIINSNMSRTIGTAAVQLWYIKN